jgi:short-subunit dehydrogenase
MKNVLITGGSDGIGLDIAKLLASQGDNITLVARNSEKLENALKSLPGKGHTFMTADLSKKDDIHAVARHMEQNHYDVLVNCAGVGMYGRFDELPLGDQISMIQLNIFSVTVLCHNYIHHARRGDAILNIASTLSTTSFPGLAVYSATKAYVLNLSESLWWENKKRGIYVLGFCPGVTATKFHAASGGSDSIFPAFITQTPGAVAREAITALKRRRKPKAVSGAVNRFMLFFQRALSRKSVVNMMGSFSPLHKQ